MKLKKQLLFQFLIGTFLVTYLSWGIIIDMVGMAFSNVFN